MEDKGSERLGVLENDMLRVEYPLAGGLRALRLFRTGSKRNLLAETPEHGWITAYGRFNLLGGHRLWHAPQNEHTAVPETMPLDFEHGPNQVTITQAADPESRLVKSIALELVRGAPVLRLLHKILNSGGRPYELSLWSITQLPLGGYAVVPLPEGPLANAPYGPNRSLHFWPYVALPDPRLELTNNRLRFSARQHETEFKLGIFTDAGWAAYTCEGDCLIKRFEPAPGARYPDGGCNVEIYCNNAFFELETLGPLVTLDPGQSVTYLETWEVRSAEEVDL